MQSRREWKSAQFSSVDVPVMNSTFCFPEKRSNALFREKEHGLRQPILVFDNRFPVKLEHGFNKNFAVFNTPRNYPYKISVVLMVFNVKMEELKSYAPFAPQTPRLRAGRAHRALDFAVPQKMCHPGHRACWDRSAPEHCGSPGDYPAHVWNTGYRILPDSQSETD